MKKFEFSLDGVQRFKEQSLNLIKMEYSAAQNAVIEQEEKITVLRAAFHNANEELKEKNAKGTSVLELNTVKTYLITLQKRIDAEIIRLAKLNEEADEVKQRMIEAKVESASIDMLKDRQYSEYRTASQKSEDSFIEEFISSKIYRSS